MEIKANIKIYHRKDRSRFFEMADAIKFGDVPTLVLAYEYEGSIDLFDVFRANNRVDGSAIEVVPDGVRSLSVGDVVVIGEIANEVLSAGWGIVDTDRLIDAIAVAAA